MKSIISVGLFSLLLFNYPVFSGAQSMRSLFLILPDKCTPGLDKPDRKALITQTEEEYTVPGHSEENKLDYSIDTATSNYLSYEYSNRKGKGRNVAYEMKKLRMSNGKYILLISKSSDTRATSNKYDCEVFNISDSTLTESKEAILPPNLDYSVFLKNNTPQAIKDSIKKTSLCVFDLDIDESNKIIFYIVLNSDRDEKWLAGNIVELTWTGSTFKSTLTFQKEN